MVPTATRYASPPVAGNRCGHNPRKPRLELCLVGTRGRPFPWIIRLFLERIEWLYHDRTLFPTLGPRKRTERLEAMVQVAKALGRNLDRLTLRCGRVNPDGTFTGITMKTIASWARMSRQRAFRALWDLRDAGFVDCTQPIEVRPNGDRRGLAGIRRIRRQLFERLRLAPRLSREQKQLHKDRQAATREGRAATIAERRAAARLIRQSRRAAVLTARTIQQLAAGAAPSPKADRTFSPAELAARLRAWRERENL